MATTTVSCPATSANLGPGFDALGLALDLRNGFRVDDQVGGFQVTGSGPGADAIPQGEDNLLIRAYQATRQELGLPPATGLHVDMELAIPPGRGLGSSATAVAAGILAAETISSKFLDEQTRVQLAVGLEGHPDNVVPCLLGGFCVCVREPDGRVVYGRSGLFGLRGLVVAIPHELELSTREMRQALPDVLPFADAVHTCGRSGLLTFALLQGRQDLLAAALDDRLHEPYRGRHIPGLESVRAAAQAAGAYGLVISGSGPTLLAWSPPEHQAEVEQALKDTWQAEGVSALVRTVGLDTLGAQVVG